MRVIEKEVDKFDELPQNAKDHVFETWRNGDHYFWHDDNEKVLKEFESLFHLLLGSTHPYPLRRKPIFHRPERIEVWKVLSNFRKYIH